MNWHDRKGEFFQNAAYHSMKKGDDVLIIGTRIEESDDNGGWLNVEHTRKQMNSSKASKTAFESFVCTSTGTFSKLSVDRKLSLGWLSGLDCSNIRVVV